MKIFLLLTLLAISIFSQQFRCSDKNTIKVTGNAQVKVKPDFATIQIGINRQEKTTSAALQSLNQKIDQLLQIIRQQGIQQSKLSGQRIVRVLRIQSKDSQRFIPFMVNSKVFARDFKTLVPIRDIIVQASLQVWFSISP